MTRTRSDAETPFKTLDWIRAFLNLWFAKHMVCMRVPFHENDGNHENDEDHSDSYKQGGGEFRISGNHGNHRNGENNGDPGCKPQVHQTTGLQTSICVLKAQENKPVPVVTW